MGCNGQVLLLLDDTSLWAIFAGGESELMDLSPAHIKIDKSPTGRGRALLQRQCFYDQKKYICNRPLAPNNLHGKMHKHKTTRGWRGERLGHSQTINVWFIFISFGGHCILSKRGEMKGRQKRAIKKVIYMEVALLCHMWSYGSWQEPSGHISSPRRGSKSAPPPRLRQWPLPSLSAWPLCITTHSDSAHIPLCFASADVA